MKKWILTAVLALVGTFSLTACKKEWKPLAEDVKKITVGASASPHAEILEKAKDLLKDKGFDLDIKVFDDYIIPNKSVDNGELDANYFQHITYLNDFNEKNHTHLVSVGAVHYEPFAIYKGQKDSLSAIAKNDRIIVPNDTTNEARALLLLQEAGWITLKNTGITATKLDITDNPYQLEIVEMEAAQIPSARKDGAFAIINGNYALAAGLTSDDALEFESNSGVAAQAYANVLAVHEGNEKHPAVLALYEVLTSQQIKDFITQKYGGSVIPL